MRKQSETIFWRLIRAGDYQTSGTQRQVSASREEEVAAAAVALEHECACLELISDLLVGKWGGRGRVKEFYWFQLSFLWSGSRGRTKR